MKNLTCASCARTSGDLCTRGPHQLSVEGRQREALRVSKLDDCSISQAGRKTACFLAAIGGH